MFVFSNLGHSSAHRNWYRYFHLEAIEYDTKIKVFDESVGVEVVQSFVEGDDPDGYTYLGKLYIEKYPHTEFKLISPWASSIGASQINLEYYWSAQTRLTQSELRDIVLSEAAMDLNSPAPSEEFERMQKSGFLNLIANNQVPPR